MIAVLRFLIVVGVLLSFGTAAADYLEIRRAANLKGEPESDGDVRKKLSVGTNVQLLSSDQRNGYYKVRTQEDEAGWVYRTLVRRHPGDAPFEESDQPQPATSALLSTDSFKIATFNIRVFGEAKADKPDVMATLAGIVRKYPLVAIQEIKNKEGVVPGQFLTEINKGGSSYAMVVSPRTGLQDDDTHGKEQYVYYYDTDKIEPIGVGLLYADEQHDRFQREPFLQRFRVRDGSFTFVLVSIHTDPDVAVDEIGALHHVNEWARIQFPDEDDIIVLGDYNASCDYAKPDQLDVLQIRAPLYTWVVPDGTDTNVSTGSACAYDRIVFRNGTLEDSTGNWGVDRAFTDTEVSDHWPVWAEFYSSRDGTTLTSDGPEPPKTCCRTCKASQACGDACIAKGKTCHQPSGCACQAN